MENSNLISDLQVMRSAAGYYVGRSYLEDGMEMPYSRENDYFSSEKDANCYLSILLDLEE